MPISSYTTRVATLANELRPAWMLAGQNSALRDEYALASVLRDEICDDMANATSWDAKQAHADLYSHVTNIMGDYGSYRVHYR